MNKALITGFVLAACIICTSCNQNTQNNGNSKTKTETATGDDGTNYEIERNKDKGTVRVVSDAGDEVTATGRTDKLPKNFPADVYVPQGSIQSSSMASTGDGTMYTVIISCQEEINTLKNNIVNKFKSAGWDSPSILDSGTDVIISADKGGNSANITLSASGKRTTAIYSVFTD